MCTEERVDASQRGHACYDGQGQGVPCCAWEPAPWVPPYMSLASLTLLWTVFLCGQVRKFVISATIAQWCARPPPAAGHADANTCRRCCGVCMLLRGSWPCCR